MTIASAPAKPHPLLAMSAQKRGYAVSSKSQLSSRAVRFINGVDERTLSRKAG